MGPFLKFHTCDRRERGRGGGNRIISRPLLNIFTHSLRSLSLSSISDSRLGLREKSPPCGSPQKYKDMYCHKPHIFFFSLSLFHAQILSFRCIILSVPSLSLIHPLFLTHLHSNIYLPTHNTNNSFPLLEKLQVTV